MKTFELERGQNGLELYLMAELPSNIIMADEFAKQIDGFQQIFPTSHSFKGAGY